MAQVFISYAEEDRAIAHALAEALASAGLSVWWDRNIAPGTHWSEAIEAALRAAQVVVVLWSASSVGSRWVRAEANEAWERGTLVPALVDGSEPPLPFRTLQTADLRRWTHERGFESSELEALRNAVVLRLEQADPVRPTSEGRAFEQGTPPDRPLPAASSPSWTRFEQVLAGVGVSTYAIGFAVFAVFGQGLAATLLDLSFVFIGGTAGLRARNASRGLLRRAGALALIAWVTYSVLSLGTTELVPLRPPVWFGVGWFLVPAIARRRASEDVGVDRS